MFSFSVLFHDLQIVVQSHRYNGLAMKFDLTTTIWQNYIEMSLCPSLMDSVLFNFESSNTVELPLVHIYAAARDITITEFIST